MNHSLKYLIDLYIKEYRKQGTWHYNKASSVINRLGMIKTCRDYKYFNEEFEMIIKNIEDNRDLKAFYYILNTLTEARKILNYSALDIQNIFLEICNDEWREKMCATYPQNLIRPLEKKIQSLQPKLVKTLAEKRYGSDV